MSKANKLKSIWIYVLMGIGAAILLFVLAVNPFIKKLLAERIADKLIGNFHYSYDQLTVDLLDRSVQFDHVTWRFPKDTTLFNHVGYIDRFRINGISLISLLKGKHIRIKEIQFDSMVMITRMYVPSNPDTSEEVTSYDSAFNFYDLIKGQVKSLKVQKIVINNSTATWLKSNTQQVWIAIDQVQVKIKGIELDSALAATHNGWFTLKDAEVEGRNGIFFLPDSLHKVRLGKFAIDYKKERIKIDSLQVIPLFTKTEMQKEVHYETDRLEIAVPCVLITGMDMKKLLYEDKLRIQHVHIIDFNLIAFKDKHAPEWHSRYIRLPNVALKQAPLSIKIDSITLTNAYIRSEQLSSLTNKKGYVFFSDLNAAFSNITNDSITCTEKPYAKLKASAKFMGTSQLNVNFTFNLASTVGDHWFRGSLEPFDLTQLNATTFVPLGAISVRSGFLDKLEFDVRLNNEVSDGRMTFLYSNLKVDLLNKDQLKSRGFDTSMKSLLTNTFFLNTSNPIRNGDPRIGSVHFRRSTDKAIFHFWWRSIFEGIKSSTLKGEERK